MIRRGGGGGAVHAVPRGLTAMVTIALTGLLAGCGGGPVTYTSGYEPAHLEEVAGSEVKKVELTKIGADQLELAEATVEQVDELTAIPYAALIYDDQGVPWTYTSTGERTYLRHHLTIERIDGDRVLLSDGPSVGTAVVTVGSAELWGAELEIGGGH